MEFSHQQLLAQVESCSLPAGLFSHQAHLQLAWACLEQQPSLWQAAQLLCGLIRRYAMALGAAEKFHHTLTVAALLLVAAKRQQQADFRVWLQQKPVLQTDLATELGRYYSPAQLAAGKLCWCEPDLQPLPQMEQLDVQH